MLPEHSLSVSQSFFGFSIRHRISISGQIPGFTAMIQRFPMLLFASSSSTTPVSRWEPLVVLKIETVTVMNWNTTQPTAGGTALLSPGALAVVVTKIGWVLHLARLGNLWAGPWLHCKEDHSKHPPQIRGSSELLWAAPVGTGGLLGSAKFCHGSEPLLKFLVPDPPLGVIQLLPLSEGQVQGRQAHCSYRFSG